MNKLKESFRNDEAATTVLSAFVASAICLILVFIISIFVFVNLKHESQAHLEMLAIEYAQKNILGEDYICGESLVVNKLDKNKLKCETAGEDVILKYDLDFEFIFTFKINHQLFAKAGPKYN